MNQALDGLLEGMRRALREDVAPELTSAHARGQVAGVIDILSKLERLVAWSPDLLRAQLAVIVDQCRVIDERLSASGVEPRWSIDLESKELASQAELEAHLTLAKARLAAVVDWLFDPKSQIPADVRREVDSLARAAMRETLTLERRRISRADFSGMTGATS